MLFEMPRLPSGSWLRIAKRTIVFSIAVIAIAEIGSCWAGYLVNGKISWIDIGFAFAFGAGIAAPILIYLSIIIEKLRHANDQLEQLARVDGLTGALTRTAFAQAVQNEMYPQTSSEDCDSLLVIDIDNFKSINDQYGHNEGDHALILIARAIRQILRPTDSFGRLGGEEFGVFVKNVTMSEALSIAERLRVAIASIEFAPKGAPQKITASIGIAPAQGGLAFTQLYKMSDECLYRAKRNGRNRIESLFVGDIRPTTNPAAA